MQERLSSGALTETGAASVRTSIKHETDARSALTRVEYALYVADPDTYSNPYANVITRTRPAFHTQTTEATLA